MGRLEARSISGQWNAEPIKHGDDDEAGVGNGQDRLAVEPIRQPLKGNPRALNHLRPTLSSRRKGTTGVGSQIEGPVT